MFTLVNYVQHSESVALKESIKDMFRNEFKIYVESRFKFSILKPLKSDLKEAVERNFMLLNGKMYHPKEWGNLLILALDKSPKYQTENQQLISKIKCDFQIVVDDYNLGNDPTKKLKQ